MFYFSKGAKTIFWDIRILFSSTNKNRVLIPHTKEIIKILKNGILLKPTGYKMERPPENIIASCVLDLKSMKQYKLINAPTRMKK